MTDKPNPPPRVVQTIDFEEAAAEAKQDRDDLARLKLDVSELAVREDVDRLLKRILALVDGNREHGIPGIAPAIIAKVMLIGDRPGSAIYQLTVLEPALASAEEVACIAIAHALRDTHPLIAATILVAGAVWLAEQSGVTREQLIAVIGGDLSRREMRADRRGAGAIDFVDNDGLGNREWLVDAIGKARLPAFAPLEYAGPRS